VIPPGHRAEPHGMRDPGPVIAHLPVIVHLGRGLSAPGAWKLLAGPRRHRGQPAPLGLASPPGPPAAFFAPPWASCYSMNSFLNHLARPNEPVPTELRLGLWGRGDWGGTPRGPA
jgi:hypothetical protein